MSKFKPGLGRGLDALLKPTIKDDNSHDQIKPSDEILHDDGKSIDILVKIPILDIIPNQFQPRITFETSALDELKKSILENGLIQPITVRRIEEGKF